MYKARYLRQLQLPGFGPEAQQKLGAANILVIGAGGLGVPVLQYLASMGIGTIGIVDGDTVELSNLHRQVLYAKEDIGSRKALVAAAKLRAMNDEITIHPYPVFLQPENALELIGKYDIVVDATDNFSARYLINDACVILKKPFVYGSVHQYEGHVSTFNVDGGPTYRCLYPEQPAAHEIPDCNVAGILGIVPGMVGMQQALEVVKLITGIGKNLSSYLQIFNFLNGEQYKIKLSAKPEHQLITQLKASYEAGRSAYDTKKIDPYELQHWYKTGTPFLILDVRDVQEYEDEHLPNAQHWNLDLMKQESNKISAALPIVIYCQKGNRSAKAANYLGRQRPELQLYELIGGLENWQKEFNR